MSRWTIRPAEERDLPELVAIYNHYVEHSHVTFDLETYSVADRRPWFESFSTSGRYRLLVAEDAGAADGGEVVGYASSAQFRTKAAYHPSVESSVYVSPHSHRRGVGAALYEALLAILHEEPNVHRVYGGIALPNEASVTLHERCGFDHVGTFREVGYKFGRYWDVAWYERDVS